MKKEIPLWTNEIPFFDESFGQPCPSITYIPPCAGNALLPCAERGCVIVLPGGGYGVLCDYEGEPVAQMYADAGYGAFVLHYRVKPYTYRAMLADVHRAVRTVRFLAEEYAINPNKIAVLGFSAGGHLAAMAAEHFDGGSSDGDEIDRCSSRPDAALLCYPVITLSGVHTHIGSRDNFLGDRCHDSRLQKVYSAECAVRSDMPPVFLWHTADDEMVDVRNTLAMTEAVRSVGVSVESHVILHGPHGMSLCENDPHNGTWKLLSCQFLQALGF